MRRASTAFLIIFAAISFMACSEIVPGNPDTGPGATDSSMPNDAASGDAMPADAMPTDAPMSGA